MTVLSHSHLLAFSTDTTVFYLCGVTFDYISMATKLRFGNDWTLVVDFSPIKRPDLGVKTALSQLIRSYFQLIRSYFQISNCITRSPPPLPPNPFPLTLHLTTSRVEGGTTIPGDEGPCQHLAKRYHSCAITTTTKAMSPTAAADDR